MGLRRETVYAVSVEIRARTQHFNVRFMTLFYAVNVARVRS